MQIIDDYIPERDDYDNWQDDWDRFTEWYNEPSTTYVHPSKFWLDKDQLPRKDRPCYMDNKQIRWHMRENDKPVNIMMNGIRSWGRIRIPLYTFDDSFTYVLHRDHNRPAVVYQNGYKKWYINGRQYFPEIRIIELIENNPSLIEYLIQDLILPIQSKYFSVVLQELIIKHDVNNQWFKKIPRHLITIPELVDLRDIGL